MLVMQDVQLGLLIAVMPTLIQAQSGDLDRSVSLFILTCDLLHTHTHTHTHKTFKWVAPFVKHSFLFGGLRVLYLLAQVLVSLAAVLLLCLLLKSFLIGPFYKKLHAESKGNKEILVLGMAAFVFFMLTVYNLLLRIYSLRKSCAVFLFSAFPLVFSFSVLSKRCCVV